jgi:hypothetical protein
MFISPISLHAGQNMQSSLHLLPFSNNNRVEILLPFRAAFETLPLSPPPLSSSLLA